MIKETVKREKCSTCKSEEIFVNHYFKEGHHDRIFLECCKCGKMVSRLIVHAQIAPNSYKEFLHKMSLEGDMGSRKIMDDYKVHEERAILQFARVKDILTKLKNTGKLETSSITELCSYYQIVEDDLN